MDYLELIQRLWDFNQKTTIGSTAITMYLYLLKIGYDKNSCDLQISDVVISKELGLTRKTIKSTKEKLENFGLIQFQTKNGVSSNYRLVVDYSLPFSDSESIKKEEFKTENFFQKIENPEILSKENTPIQDFPKNISQNANQEDEINSLKTIQSSPTQQQQQQISPAIEIAKNIPSLDEFMEYAKTIETYEPYLDSEIKSRYEDWKNNNWRNGSDRPITNWKSSLKSSLPFMKNQMERHQLSLQSIPYIKRPKSQNDN